MIQRTYLVEVLYISDVEIDVEGRHGEIYE
jgi:hypothetical protein